MKKVLSRRVMMQEILGVAILSSGRARGLIQQARRSGQPTGQEMGEMNRIDQAFRRQYQVPASSIAISWNGQFVYDRAGGMADKQQALQVQQSSLFRIASLSKPITSVAVFMLVEQGRLNLSDKVFGTSGVLGLKYGRGPYKQYITDVTVDHLLTHTSGGWPDDSTDPMFSHEGWDHQKLIEWTIQNLPLTYPPGQHWAYSNFGYCVLGRVIEAVTGQSYAGWVQANVLAPCGTTDMQIAANRENQRAANEVVYYGQFGENPYNMNVTRMDSHGGWIGASSDLVKFLNHVGGASGIPSLLKPATIKMMTTPAPAYDSTAQARYARGWMVRNNGAGNWWHNGSLPGSTTIMVRTPSGMCWSALTNTRSQPSNEIDASLDQMMWNMVRCVPGWGV
jgi:CubicO group peptidase (beta-lactamase class C family)